MPAMCRVGDKGQGTCNIHGPVGVTFTKAGQSTLYANGILVCVVGAEGVGDCGDHTVATTGSPDTFAEGKAIHRITDAGVFDIVGGNYNATTGSPDTFAN